MGQTTQNSRDIKATEEKIYNAFINPAELEIWQAPGDMTARVHNFDLRVGGGYQMSLFYPDNEKEMKGKTADKDRLWRLGQGLHFYLKIFPGELNPRTMKPCCSIFR
jgi:hypothetical protein